MASLPPRPPYESMTITAAQDNQETADVMLRASLATYAMPENTMSSSPEITTFAPSAPRRFSFRRITSAMTLRSTSPTPDDQLSETNPDPIMLRLQQLEQERDELFAAAQRERDRAYQMERAVQEERLISERIKRESYAGPSAAEIELRLLQLKYDALLAGADAKPRATDGLFGSVCSTDLLFLMDTTGSMGSYIEAAKTQVRQIMDDITSAFFGEATVRIAVVGYKDHKDKPNVQFLDFTTDIEAVKTFLLELKATGGDDEPEDVLGGIRQALDATWKQQTRCIIHIADAPPHGSNLHDVLKNGGIKGRDDWDVPGSEPHGLRHEQLIRQMVGLNINYALLRINNSTDRMAFEFLKVYANSAASSHCKVLHQNIYHADARRITTQLSRSSSKRSSAKAGLQFEEVELGTSYNALRHLVVKSVTTSASRTAVRAIDGLGKLDPELEGIKEDEEVDDFPVKPMAAGDAASKWDAATNNGDTLVKSSDGGASSSISKFKARNSRKKEYYVEVDKSQPQWDVPGWLDEILVAEAFSTNLTTNPLDKMLASDAEMNNQISTNELTIHKRSQPFAQGAMRVAAYARTANSSNKLVVKTFKKGGKRLAHLVEDMWCQALCKAFALEFNSLVSNPAHHLDFIMVTCLKPKPPSPTTTTTTTTTDDPCSEKPAAPQTTINNPDVECLTLEPYIDGHYTKYNSNSGYVNDDLASQPPGLLFVPGSAPQQTNSAAQAFSHFTFERSRGAFLIADLQGVGSMLTDPAIHSRDPNRFKLADTNLGEAGFKFFFATHTCNDVCRTLGLKSTGRMVMVGNYEFREDWQTPTVINGGAKGGVVVAMGNTVCCSNKLCSRIVRVPSTTTGNNNSSSSGSSSVTSDKFPGYFWCDTCLPQLASSVVKFICVARSGPHHEFEVSRFFYESQGRVLPRVCPGHLVDELYIPIKGEEVTGMLGARDGGGGGGGTGKGEGEGGSGGGGRSLVRKMFCLPAVGRKKK